MNKVDRSFKCITWLAATALGALLAACGGGGGGSGSQSPILGGPGIAELAPAVTAVSPLPNATGVAFNTRIITAAFNKAMDPATITAANFTLACPVGTAQSGAVSYTAAGSIATLTLAANLPGSTICTATITTGVRDTSGNALASAFVWTFTTGPLPIPPDTTPPTVSSVFPLVNALNVPFNSIITASFSEAMNPATIIAANFLVSCPTGSSITGAVTYAVGGNVATFTPTLALPPSTTCTATITTGVKDVAGNAMVLPFVWSFSTGALPDRTAPTVISTIPLANATNVPFNTLVSANFSEAMNPLTITTANFKLACPSGVAVVGTVAYAVSGNVATFTPLTPLPAGTTCTATIGTGVTDVAGNPMANAFAWNFSTGTAGDVIPPTIVSTFPVSNASNVPLSVFITTVFSEPMDPLTINTATMKLVCPTGFPIVGVVTYHPLSKSATFSPVTSLPASTTCTATVTNGAKDLAGNTLVSGVVPNPWNFNTGFAVGPPNNPPVINLRSASTFGDFGGSAGSTNQGLLTVINGDLGTTAVSTLVTGFHDATAGCIYTETPLNVGFVNGNIYSSPPPPTVGCPTEGTAVTAAAALQARADALTAYNQLVAMPGGPDPGAGNLANLVLAPGDYTAASGSFLIRGGNLTLDAQGDVNATWVFQMANALTVGGPGAAFPQSVLLVNGAQSKNVFWQVGSAATINAGGGGTMEGTIISQSGVSISTPGNVTVVTLNGRAISLGASVTVVNTVINVPGP